MIPDAKRPGPRTPVDHDQQAGKLTESENDSNTRRLTVDRSHVAMLEAEVTEVRNGREMPAALMRWSSPEDCADELLEVFGPHWCRMLSVALRELVRGVR